jgi:hypothetical protein
MSGSATDTVPGLGQRGPLALRWPQVAVLAWIDGYLRHGLRNEWAWLISGSQPGWPGVRRAGLPRLSLALTPGPAPRSGAA